MKIKITGIITVFIAIIVITMFSGCTNEKISAAEDINMATSLINSGADRIKNIDFEVAGYSDAKIKLSSSKVDYEEALKILNNAKTDYDDEMKIIEMNKITSSYSLDIILALQYLIISMEHFDKSVAYMEGDDFTTIKSELTLASEALTDSKPFIAKAKTKSLSIDIDTIPVEYRSMILEDKLSIEEYDKMLSGMGGMMSAMNPFLDGIEHMDNAVDYMEKEEWKNAELEFGNSYADFSISKNIFKNLKNSEFTEVAVTAIESDAFLIDVLDELPHFEAGCRYMSEGNYYKADEEFSKISEY